MNLKCIIKMSRAFGYFLSRGKNGRAGQFYIFYSLTKTGGFLVLMQPYEEQMMCIRCVIDAFMYVFYHSCTAQRMMEGFVAQAS